MANGPRSIYSRRQRMAPGQYDNRLADFLDNLPDYFNQYHQQQLQTQKYKDSQKQQEFTNELNLIRSLPEDAQANAFATSKIPRMQSAGIQMQSKKQAFTDRLNSVYTENAGDPTATKAGLEALLSNPDIINNESYITKINNRIEIESPKVARQQVDAWAKDNPDDPRINEIVAMSKLDSEKALGLIVPAKPSVSGILRGVYNPYTEESAFKTDAQIKAGVDTDTRDDDWIPISAAPTASDGIGINQLPSIIKTIETIQRGIRNIRGSDLSPEDAARKEKLQGQLLETEQLRDSIMFPNRQPKTIPGF
tara:strand:- start:1397 stop:2320 length:924 start_codon:yes stop_codon:yes gene_type:complete